VSLRLRRETSLSSHFLPQSKGCESSLLIRTVRFLQDPVAVALLSGYGFCQKITGHFVTCDPHALHGRRCHKHKRYHNGPTKSDKNQHEITLSNDAQMQPGRCTNLQSVHLSCACLFHRHRRMPPLRKPVSWTCLPSSSPAVLHDVS
jgi:hypothetical protein